MQQIDAVCKQRQVRKETWPLAASLQVNSCFPTQAMPDHYALWRP